MFRCFSMSRNSYFNCLYSFMQWCLLVFVSIWQIDCQWFVDDAKGFKLDLTMPNILNMFARIITHFWCRVFKHVLGTPNASGL